MCRIQYEQERKRKLWCHCLTKEVSLLMNCWKELNSATCVPWVVSWWIKDLIWFMVSIKRSNKDVIMRTQQRGGTGSCGLVMRTSLEGSWWELSWFISSSHCMIWNPGNPYEVKHRIKCFLQPFLKRKCDLKVCEINLVCLIRSSRNM